MIKRLLALTLCALLAVSFTLVVNAEEETTESTMPQLPGSQDITRDEVFASTAKTFSLYMSETHGHVKIDPMELTVWERPMLESGQNGIVGEMTVKNAGNIASTLKMSPVPLPYDNEEAMTYLNYVILKITDKETGEVLFHDSYAHINDPVDPALVTTTAATTVAGETAAETTPALTGFTLMYENMQPGETHTYQIEMRCLSTFDGIAPTDLEMPWTFEAQMKTSGVQEEQNKLPEWVVISLIGLAATIALLIVVAILRAIAAFVKKRKNPVDNEE